jgi:hypothetical protein
MLKPGRVGLLVSMQSGNATSIEIRQARILILPDSQGNVSSGGAK